MPKLKIWNATFQQHYSPLAYGASTHLNLSPFEVGGIVCLFKRKHLPDCVAGHGQGHDSTSVRG